MSRSTTHTTRKEAEHIRRATRPPSSSLSIERSEHFPNCLLEIPLATPWPKQTFRLATRTYSLTTTIFLLPVGSSLSIIPMCVLSLSTASSSLHHQPSLALPPFTTWPRSHSEQPGAAVAAATETVMLEAVEVVGLEHRERWEKEG